MEGDDVMDFFDFSKPFKRVLVPSGTFAGRIKTNSEETSTCITKREKEGTEYAQKYVEAEQLEIFKNIKRESAISNNAGPSSSRNTSFHELDDIEEPDKQPCLRSNDDIYKEFDCIGSGNIKNLPIYRHREQILSLIKNNRVVIIEGDTGCGKTTQVPQYILEDAAKNGEFCNIVCTQPRRIAAISITKRVCEEKSFAIGSIVGYQVGLHENASPNTRLLFCTTGVLLQKLIGCKDMSRYTHVILDEVHERDQDMDFLLIVVRRFLATVSQNTKVILMSATMNSQIFSDYFKFIHEGTYVKTPILKIDQNSRYSLQCFYINQLEDLKCNLDINYEDPNISDDTYKIALKLVLICNSLDKKSTDITFGYLPTVLIFLPGINEIDKMNRHLDTIAEKFESIKFITIRLHSMVSPQEQQQAFIRPPKGYRKIILATNIAESSITVPDVKYVLDFCLTKSLMTDTSTNLSSLQLHWASQASCVQRAGRAGRVMDGRVYRLVSQHFYDHYMEKHSTPEMIRCPLENIVLRAKMLNFGPPHTVLGLALSPPNLSDICNTILTLKEAGALFKTVNEKYDAFDGDLTFMGKVMAALPLDIQLTRLIIFGYIFSVLDDTIIIAAGLSVKSIFNCGQKDLQAFVQKLTWSDGSGSDLIAILKAYRVWISMSERNIFENEDREANWARRYYINTKSMREMHILVAELRERLNNLGIKEFSGTDRVNWLDHERSIILKICIAGAFYPNYFLRSSSRNSFEGERDAFHTLCGYDPCNTVYFTGFDNNKYIGELYVDQIKALFQKAMIPTKNIKVRFVEGTQKIFVIFSNDTENENLNQMTLFMPGRVCTDVYKAVKMRSCNNRSDNYVKVFRNKNDEIQFAETHGYGNMLTGKWVRQSKMLPDSGLVILPSLRTRYIRGKITHIEHCGKFWFQPVSEVQEMKQISQQLNNPNNLMAIPPNEIVRGMQLAALVENRYHRVRVINLEDKARDRYHFKVFFIDYGNIDVIDSQRLRNFNIRSISDLPPRCFQCGLAGIQTSTINCRNGRWSREAIELMKSKCDECENLNGNVRLEIYSVVNGIASVMVQIMENKILNDTLVEEGYGQYTEENYVSKIDHDLRERTQHVKQYEDRDCGFPDEYLQSLLNETEDDELPKPSVNNCTYRVDLRGPNSPLEVKIHAPIRIGSFKTVKVERESVNCVLLDSDPQESRERLVVAASMSEGNEKSALTARSTTLMPNISGFAALMCLIFCPTMEIRRDHFKNVYTSILAGLGYDAKTKKGIFEEHDMVLNLDVEITPNDVELINQIRYTMDTLLSRDVGEDLPRVTYKNRIPLIGQMKNLIIKLLEKPRRFIEIQRTNKEHLWHQIDENDLLMTRNVYGHQALFPFHSVMRLYELKYDRIYTLAQENQKLHNLKLSNIDLKSEQVKCKLCDENIENIVHLRIHLLSQLHKDREAQINFKLQ